MAVTIDVRVIDKGDIVASGSAVSDDWDAASQDIGAAVDQLKTGQWIEARIKPGSDPMPENFHWNY